jgi:hypothetical protein
MSIISWGELSALFGGGQSNDILFGTVDAGYTSGRPKVVYDIDISTGALSKTLPYLASYTPAANDRVMIVKGVIVGKII